MFHWPGAGSWPVEGRAVASRKPRSFRRGQCAYLSAQWRRPTPDAIAQVIDAEQRRKINRAGADGCADQSPGSVTLPSIGNAITNGISQRRVRKVAGGDVQVVRTAAIE